MWPTFVIPRSLKRKKERQEEEACQISMKSEPASCSVPRGSPVVNTDITYMNSVPNTVLATHSARLPTKQGTENTATFQQYSQEKAAGAKTNLLDFLPDMCLHFPCNPPPQHGLQAENQLLLRTDRNKGLISEALSQEG